MKAGWKTTTLGEVCTLIARGVAPKYVDGGGTLVLNQKCIRDHAISYALGRKHDEAAKRIAADRFIRVADVLVNSTGTGTLGRVAQVRSDPPERTTVDTHVTIVRPMASEFYPDFFGYALLMLEDQLAAGGEGASGQTELARTTIAKFEITYPTNLDAQRRIAAVLDEAFAAIATATANAEKNLELATQLFETVFTELFTRGDDWTEQTVSELVDSGVLQKPLDGNHGAIHPTKSEFVSSGVPFIMASDLSAGNVDLEGCYFLTVARAKSLRKGFARSGDILISHKGTIGRVAALHTDYDYVVLTPQVTYYRVAQPDKISPAFLFFALQAPEFQSEMRRIAGAGSTRAYIGITAQLGLKIRFPSLKTQVSVVEQLVRLSEDIEALKAVHKTKATALLNLKASLLARAFSDPLYSAGVEAIAA